MHFKEERKKHLSKAALIVIIVLELITAAALCCVGFFISWNHIVDRRVAAIDESIDGFNTAAITKDTDAFYQKASEQIKEERDEQVWAKKDTNYRTGPDLTYERVGTLSQYSGMKRTGVTYNKWSQVMINEETYYIVSRNLTTEEPLITAGGQKGEYQRYALSLLGNYGWAESEIRPLIKLWDRESGWNPSSHNGSSGAHGIPQALPASKMASYGSDYYTNGNTQIRWGLHYISGRYGSPSNAWAHFCSSGWY